MSKKELVENVVESGEDILNETLDIVENQLDRVVTVTKNNPFLLAGVAVIAAGIGAFVGYKIASKRVTAVYEDEIMPKQLAMAQSFQRRLAKTDEFDTVESAAQALIPDQVVDAVRIYSGQEKIAYNNIPLSKETAESAPEPETPTVAEQEEIVSTAVDRNVFSPANDPRDWDYKAEVVIREENPDKPYVISVEEHGENPDDHDQVTLTYYEKDDTLVDERSQPIDNVDKIVGDDNLERFGHGSEDLNVVYVRNDAREMDFEIIRDPGAYAVEVLGLDEPETTIKHSHQRRSRRHRADE